MLAEVLHGSVGSMVNVLTSLVKSIVTNSKCYISLLICTFLRDESFIVLPAVSQSPSVLQF